MENNFDINLYNDDFFEWHLKHAREYSVNTMNWYIETFNPKSIIDFGCGIGSYLESGYINGIDNLKGYDIGGESAKKYTPEYIQQYITYADCTKEIITEKYDCVISFETAEHIDPSGTDVFVKNICNAVNETGTILFTGAPPNQQGTGHINCQPKEFWIDKFLGEGCVYKTELTKKISQAWKELGAPDYICNNLIVFIK